jgi:hypothetical protein
LGRFLVLDVFVKQLQFIALFTDLYAQQITH